MLAGMESVLQYRIPELHPLAVHFPVSLLIMASVAAVVWMWRGTAFWRGATWLLTVVGTGTAYLAFLTGDAMEEQSEGVPIVDELVGLHEDMALYTLVAACVASVLLSVLGWRARGRGLERDSYPVRIAIGVLVVLVGALVAWTGHIGATMTWGVSS